ncbi:MAG: acyltransferase [Desulfomonilia bacterium]|nr:acyltransferase [Desulfomonilia bacterium]
MIRTLPSHTRGALAFFLMVINTVIWAVPVHILALTKILIRNDAWQKTCARALMSTVNCWIWGILNTLKLTQDTSYDIQGREGLSRNEWYFLNSNHQSWADILVLLITFHGYIPFFKFFLKKQLIWVPLLGTSFWALDYPYMERFSKSFLEKNPGMKGKDLETTIKACEQYQHTPVSILNFIEGTRFTREKHEKQQSPYKHLLRPKAGGFAFALAAMKGKITSILDVTIMYPPMDFTFWDYLCGRIPSISVRVKKLGVPTEFLDGDYLNDADYQNRFKTWVNTLWEEKDALIERHRAAQGGL